MRELIGQKLGDYEILSEIGRGAMGVVYKARQYSLDRPVALKVLSPLLASDASFVERFKREATIAATLDHPSIVRVYEAGAHLDLDNGERLHYFAMQYVEGETVHDRLQREGKLPLDEAVAIAVHVAQALEYAWRKARVIHRDIKPSNVFLSSEGEVKLGDLGLARAAGDSEGGVDLTATGSIVGTAHFMSPEQARGERALDFRSDYYSLGCMLYQMICGKYLFDGAFASVVAQHLTEPPPNLRMILPDCPMLLAAVVEKMLAKDPTGRQQSFGELITELRRAHEQIMSGVVEGGSRPPSAISASVSSSSAPSRKQLPTILYTIMGTTAVILLAGVLVLAPWKQGEQPPLNSEAAKARSAPVTQTLLPAAAASPKEEPKRASEAPADVGRVPSPGATATTTPPGQGTGPTTAALATEPPASTKPAADTPASPLPTADETPALPAKPVIQVAQATPQPAPATPAAQPSAPQPADEAFVKSVGAMTPEQKVQAVVAKLKELNPNFDGKETHKIENGVVTTLSFSTVGVTDISPVKALRWLRTLTITPPALNQKGSLENLAPLAGLQLTWLWCHNNPISNLSPLQSMPLTVLSFSGTQVSDLSPLTGMKLQVLSFNDTVVSELGPLEGMPLTVLWCNNTKVNDLSPVKAMPLREIKCDFVAERDVSVLRGIRTLTKINDLPAATFWTRVGPIAARTIPTTTTKPGQRGGLKATLPTAPVMPTSEGGSVSAKEQIRRFVEKMKEVNPAFDGKIEHKTEGRKIVEITFELSGVSNISPVSMFRDLKRLDCGADYSKARVSFSDISPLKGMLLTELNCVNCEISDLSPLIGMPLSSFWCIKTKVSDLLPLKGMPLQRLWCAGTQVSDLTPLAGLKLSILDFTKTPVSDLSAIRGMKESLTLLRCSQTQVSDLSPIKGMRLVTFWCHGAKVTDLSVLKGMPLQELTCDFVAERDTKLLKTIKSLEKINQVPVREFWKRVEAGDVPQAK